MCRGQQLTLPSALRLVALAVALPGSAYSDPPAAVPDSTEQGGRPMPRLEVTVGATGADFVGSDHIAIQGAVDYAAAHGGGTVRILPGT